MDSRITGPHTIVDSKGNMIHQCRESLYRTKWLMAHNRLHQACHEPELANREALTQHFEEYLAELKTAEEVASRPA